MSKNTRIIKIIFTMLLLSILTSVNVLDASVSSGEIIEISQIIQDVNGIGIVLYDDISSYTNTGSIVYLILALNQEYSLNGLFLIGFTSNENFFISYALGDPLDSSSLWYDSNSDLTINYGSVVYIDILDYLVSFGMPDDIKGIVLLSPFSLDDMQLNINSILVEYQEFFISVNPNDNSTSSSTSNPSSSSLSSSISTTEPISATNTYETKSFSSSSQNSNKLISSVSGFEVSIIIGLFLFPLVFKRYKD